MDPQYRSLLVRLQSYAAHLHPGIVPALSHYLSVLPLPFPTTLTASAISSPVWNDNSLPSVLIAFRQATHFKARSLLDASTPGISLSPGPAWQFRSWTHAICSGAGVGNPKVRFAALGGLLLGLEEVKETLDSGGARHKVEDEVIIAFAEFLDVITSDIDWFPTRPSNKSHSSMLQIAADVLLLVPEKKMRVINLHNLFQLSIEHICMLFEDGRFFSSKQVPSTDAAPSDHLPRIARLAAKSIDVLANNPGNRLHALWEILENSIRTLDSMAKNIETDWTLSELSTFTDESLMPSELASQGQVTWLKLKSFLFTTVMILQSVIDALLYVERPTQSLPTNPRLASSVLQTFSRISFVSARFGGLTSQTESSFREYRRTFFTALDIILGSQETQEPDRLVGQLAASRRRLLEKGTATDHPVLLAETVYLLVTVEQMVDNLSPKCLSKEVLPVCKEYISNPQLRETFEASHSVILALFASLGHRKEVDEGKVKQLRQMVPFYAASLVNCSQGGQLTNEQLRLAFSSLVIGASSNAKQDNGALTWFCVSSLVDEIKCLDLTNPDQKEQYTRLVLSLISLVPVMPSSTPLLPKLLEEIENIVRHQPEEEKKMLSNAIYEEILRRVGDGQREFILRWWFDVFNGINGGTPFESIHGMTRQSYYIKKTASDIQVD